MNTIPKRCAALLLSTALLLPLLAPSSRAATVGWDNAARTATVSKGSVSIRIVAESLSATVNWDNSTKSVQITAKGTPKVWLLTKMSSSDDSTTYSYDNANRLTSKTYRTNYYYTYTQR